MLRYLALMLVFVSVGLRAQDPPPTYIPATGYFLQARDALNNQVGPMYYADLHAWVCDQPPDPPATGILTNPRTLQIVDIDHPGRACKLDLTPWRSILPTGTRYTIWIGSTAAGYNEVAVAPGWPTFVRGMPEFNVVPTTSEMPSPTNGRLLPEGAPE